jgi:hypothetical protein
MRHSKKLAALAIAAGVAITATAALAYWTTGGSGVGEAAAGDVVDITAVQTSELDPMYPGDSPQTLSGNFNNGNAGPVYIASVTASIDSVSMAEGAPAGDCDADDFTLTNEVMLVGAEVASGDAKGAWTGAKLSFNNKETNQDACKGATVNLAYEIN